MGSENIIENHKRFDKDKILVIRYKNSSFERRDRNAEKGG